MAKWGLCTWCWKLPKPFEVGYSIRTISHRGYPSKPLEWKVWKLWLSTALHWKLWLSGGVLSIQMRLRQPKSSHWGMRSGCEKSSSKSSNKHATQFIQYRISAFKKHAVHVSTFCNQIAQPPSLFILNAGGQLERSPWNIQGWAVGELGCLWTQSSVQPRNPQIHDWDKEPSA